MTFLAVTCFLMQQPPPPHTHTPFRQLTTLKELAPPEITDPIEGRIKQDAEDILSVVQSLRMIRSVPAVTMEVVTGFGEIWSAQTLYAYLQVREGVVWCGVCEGRSDGGGTLGGCLGRGGGG